MGGEKLSISELSVIGTLGTTVSGIAENVRGYSYSPNMAAVSKSKNSRIADAVKDKDSLINNTRNTIAENMDDYSKLCADAKADYNSTEDGVKDKFEKLRKA